MSRMRWTDCSVVIVVAILAVITVVVGTRPVPGVPSPRTAGAGVEEWESYLASVGRAVEAHDVALASRIWRNAYGVAFESGRWKPMLATGQAALRIGRAGRTMGGFDAKARQCYLTALFRARDQHSIDGVLLVAEAFAQLGDIEAARAAVRMADHLAHPSTPFFISPASAISHSLD